MTEPQHILVIDDDARLRELLGEFLRSQSYNVSTVASAIEARELMADRDFDALVLDVMMPVETGLEFVNTLRAQKFEVPVLMLSARGDGVDRIAGLSAGCDDYLAKPFEPEELLLRLRNLLKRPKPALVSNNIFAFGPYQFDLHLGELRQDRKVIKLTANERDILRKLIQAQGEPVSRDELAGSSAAEDSRRIDVQITRLRQKLEINSSAPVYIQTMRGRGYAFVIAP